MIRVNPNLIKQFGPFLLFFVLLIAYWPILGWFFARDDFGFLPHLPTTLANLPAILTPPNYWFFRPLSQQFYFWLGSEIWGLNALWFRVFALGLLTFNSLLVYKLIRRFSTTSAALFGLIFYGLNTLHLFEIGWVAANYQTISTTLFLATVLLVTSPNKTHQLLSFLTLILAFLASEMSIFITPVIFIYNQICSGDIYGTLNWRAKTFASLTTNSKRIVNRATTKVLPYFILTALYLAFYFSYVHLPGGSVYGRYFDPLEMARIFAKYLLYPSVAGFDRDNPFGIVNILLATKAISIALITLVALKNHTINKKLLLFGAAWFLITVSLFTLLKGHSFAYLDAIPAIGLTLILASLWPIQLNHRLQSIALISLIALSLVTLRLAQTTDPDLKWLNDHQKASYIYLNTLTYPTNNNFIVDGNDSNLMEATFFGSLQRSFFKEKNPTITITKTK